MSSSDEGGEGGETKGQMTQRHKRELKAVKVGENAGLSHDAGAASVRTQCHARCSGRRAIDAGFTTPPVPSRAEQSRMSAKDPGVSGTGPQAQMAKLGKKKKDEADKLEAELNARHAAELAALESGGSVGGGAAEAQAELTAAPTDKLSAMALDDDVEQVRR
jgi:hypothetical protein